jgi:poly-gamma-glutamate capsule biosynthesis protein CapA/YwtB (metallophosphatase superfamily)
MSADPARLRLALCGDVMLGRGIDQILPHPGNPAIYVSQNGIMDANVYVRAAEQRHGAIPGDRRFDYVWGDALTVFANFAPDLRLINLETAITAQGKPWPNKWIHYRMNPRNVAVLVHANIDFCSLANNHVMDWGYVGLAETMNTLATAGITRAGAGRNRAHASSPAIMSVPGKGRAIIVSFAMLSGHMPVPWSADAEKPGVNLIEASGPGLEVVKRSVADVKRPNDVLIASVHAGTNFGHEIEPAERDLFRRLIDEAGFDLIHCHSSHHVKAIELHSGRPILYGTGDLINDYEGLPARPERAAFSSNVGMIAFADFSPVSGACTGLFLCPTRLRRMRVERADADDAERLAAMLNRESACFGTRIENRDGLLAIDVGRG